MPDTNDDRHNESQPRPSQLSRRTFLRGAGVASLAGALPAALLTESALAVEPKPGRQAGRPAAALATVGALFNPYFRTDEWQVLAPFSPEGAPRYGGYATDNLHAASAHLAGAAAMGLDFLFVSYCPGRPHTAHDHLFEAAARDGGVRLALYVDVDDDTGTSRALAPVSRLQQALDQLDSRYLRHESYLRDRSGHPVLGIAGGSDADMLRRALGGHSAGTVLWFPAAWRHRLDENSSPAMARALREGLYQGYSSRHGLRGARHLLPSLGTDATALLLTPARQADGIRLARLTGSRTDQPRYVVLDSFNHWALSVPLEPGTLSETRYTDQVLAWCRGQAA